MKIALLEIGDSHDECLYGQIKILNSQPKNQITLICCEKLRQNTSFFDGVKNRHFVTFREGLSEWIDLFKLYLFIEKQKFDKVLINTAQGARVKKMMLFPFRKRTLFVGILHNLKKLENSTGQRIISNRIKRYFVLNDYLLSIANSSKHTDLQFTSYYPIFFPDYPTSDIQKPDNETWICIPGQVELKRRDYESLFEGIRNTPIREGIKFILLGRCEHEHGNGAFVKAKIKELGIENRFMLWDSFVDSETFYTILEQSDFILPLIHPQHDSFSLYTNQISGSYNLAFGYKKILLMEESFRKHSDFTDNSIFYNLDSMLVTVNSAKKDAIRDPYTQEKWSLKYQSANFLSFIE